MDISILAALLKITGGLFAFLTALFSFLSVAENEQHEATQAWFRRKWEGVSQSRWRQMPERVIRAVIRGKDAFGERYVGLLQQEDHRFIWIIYIYSVLLFIAAVWISWGLAAIGIAFIAWVALIIPTAMGMRVPTAMGMREGTLVYYFFIFLFSSPAVGAGLIWTALALRADLLYAVLSIIIASPSFLFIGFPIFLLVISLAKIEVWHEYK